MSQNTPHTVPESRPTEGGPAIEFHDQLIAVLPSLRQQALAMTRNRPDADDLVQMA